jgi:manganese/zinc/iron transport system substrate-binding protein
MRRLFLLALMAVGLAGNADAAAKLKVVATVTMISDMARDVGGAHVEVQGLMGPGVDPHLYKAKASDITKLNEADVIFYNGLMLEGKMQDIFVKMARTKKHVYPVTETIAQDKLLEPPAFQGHYDPHVWFDVSMWEHCIDSVVAGLSAADPANGQDLKANV